VRRYLAIDIGASSGRHIVGWLDDDNWVTEEVYRFPNGVLEREGHLVWDVDGLYDEVRRGIAAAFHRFPDIESLSVDTWGVDYVRMKGEQTLYPCFAYRDSRTEDDIQAVHDRISFSELYAQTGCQFQPFNTIYQLYDDLTNGRLADVSDILMMPEYLMYRLTGVKAREYTNATTTGLINARTQQFDRCITNLLGFPECLFPCLTAPGTVIGSLRADIAAEVGGSCKVVLGATHDTASAVEGIPMAGNQLYISSGTWSLLGVKTPKPITDPASAEANFSNEGGVGYNRYQKNIMGLWLVNELKRELCPETGFDEIVEMARNSQCGVTVDANCSAFLAPKSMKRAFDIEAHGLLKEVGDYFRCAYRSLAVSYRDAIKQLEDNTGACYNCIYVVGGGAKNDFLNELIEKVTDKRVIALPIEATALGNLKIQREAIM